METPFMDLEEAKAELAFMKKINKLRKEAGIKVKRRDNKYRRALLEIVRLNRIFLQFRENLINELQNR